jgi:hypothetical protein
MSNRDESLDQVNAEVMADLVVDPATTDDLRVKIISKILESREGQDFFKTMFEEQLSYGACPSCNHKNHWAIPEDVLNQMGYVTHVEDTRVPANTDKKSCDRFQEACRKKKVLS